ncbi:MAG: dethiobiotin synthase [Myxococcota bacterium]|nr:dethiobiotin synthase [Myxococcota bacterium]MDW8364058.1 dethiobiotin synthase [Myxococcales bacterium]
MRGWIVTATGTGVGKTWLARGLARALVRRGLRVAAVKPVETGCEPVAADAEALARACRRPELASAPGFVRYRAPLAPLAAVMEGEPVPPPLEALAAAVRAAVGDSVGLVEGAGGVLVPLDEAHDFADLFSRLQMPVLLVAPDRLGVISETRCALEAARSRGLRIDAIVLSRFVPTDRSRATNATILERRTGLPVLAFEALPDDDEALADAAEPLLDRLRRMGRLPFELGAAAGHSTG